MITEFSQRLLFLDVRFHVEVAEKNNQRQAIRTDNVQKDWREITLVVKSHKRVNDNQNKLNLTKVTIHLNRDKTGS